MRTVSKTVIGVDFGTQSARAVLEIQRTAKLYIPVGKNIPITVHRYQQLTVRKIFPVQRIMK